MEKLITGLSIGLSSLYWSAVPVLAQVEKIQIEKPKGAIPEFSPVISGGLRIIMTVAALICLVYIIWGGIEWMTSGGEKASVAAARARLTAAFIGLIIVISAWAIIKLLEILFNIDILEFTFEPFYQE